MSIELTEDMINDMDRDGDGVDKLEFVVGLLTRLDVVHWHDVKPLLELFEKFDQDNSGKLTAADVVHQKKAWKRAAAACSSRLQWRSSMMRMWGGSRAF